MTMRSKLLILCFSSICTLTYGASGEEGKSTAAAAAAPTLAPAASKDLPLHEMLSCANPEEAHQKSKAFMDAHISNLEDYVAYLNNTAVPAKDKYKSLLLRYARFLPATPPMAEMDVRVSMLLGTLNTDLAIWKRKRTAFVEIYTSEGYAYDPENDLTALDVLYIKMFQGTVMDVMAEEGARVFRKLSYEEINTYVTTKEQAMAKKAPTEEPFDFIYSWNLVRMLRPFLSPIYLNMERLEEKTELFQAIYNKSSEKPASCVFVPNAIYGYIGDTFRDMLRWLDAIAEAGHPQTLIFVDRVNDLGATPFIKTRFHYGKQNIRMSGALKKENQKLAAKGLTGTVECRGTAKILAEKQEGLDPRFFNDMGEFILWRAGEGSFMKGYNEWVTLLNDIAEFMKANSMSAEKSLAAAGAGGTAAAAPPKAKAGKGKKLSAAEAERAEAAFLEAAAAETKKAEAVAAAKEFKDTILRLVEAQQRVAKSWEEDLAAYTASLGRHADLRTAPAPHTPAVKDWVKEIIEADMVRYYRDCKGMLERHFGLANRGGSRISVVDSVSHEMGFFDPPHAADDGHQDKGSLWRKSLKAFFERAGLYGAAGAGASAVAGAGAKGSSF